HLILRRRLQAKRKLMKHNHADKELWSAGKEVQYALVRSFSRRFRNDVCVENKSWHRGSIFKDKIGAVVGSGRQFNIDANAGARPNERKPVVSFLFGFEKFLIVGLRNDDAGVLRADD